MVKIWADLSNTDIVSADWYTKDGPGNYIDDVASGNMAITSYWLTPVFNLLLVKKRVKRVQIAILHYHMREQKEIMDGIKVI